MIFNDRSNVIPYGVCDTPSGTAAKVVTVSPNISLTEGQLIFVRFTYPNTASGPTLNVNNTGAFNLASLKESFVGATTENSWSAGQIVLIRYTLATSAYHWQTITIPQNVINNLIPQVIQLTKNDTYVSATGGYFRCYKIGRIVVVSLNFKAAASGGAGVVLFSGAPVPLEGGWCGSVVGDGVSPMRIGINMSGQIITDSTHLITDYWYNGTFVYVSAS